MAAGRLSQHTVGSSFPAEASKLQGGRRMLGAKQEEGREMRAVMKCMRAGV